MVETIGQATIGQALRSAREASGMSIARLARLASISESHARSVENGNRKVTLETAEAYDKVLITGGLLADLVIAEESEDDLKRRTLLGLLGTVTGLGVSAPKLIAEATRHDLLSAFSTDDWKQITTEYGQRFMTDSPSVFRSQLSGDLLVLRAAIYKSDSSDVRLAAPRLMTLNGMIIANMGDTVSAARWYRAARLASDRSGDDTLRQWVRGREAFRRGYEGASPHEVLATASGIDDVEAKLATAQAYARLGGKPQALAALAEARRIHEVTSQSETTIYAMPPWRMALSSSYVYALMGDTHRCEAELSAVTPPGYVKRWEEQLRIQRAVAYAKSGDAITGMQTAGKVIRETDTDQRSVVLMEMYQEVKKCAQGSK